MALNVSPIIRNDPYLLQGLGRGIEKESLRVSTEGVLSGRCTNRPDRTQPLYPVREGADGTLLIGFEKINAAIFDDDDF